MDRAEQALFLLEHEQRRSQNLRRRVENLKKVILEERATYSLILTQAKAPDGWDYWELMNKVMTVNEETRALFKIIGRKNGMRDMIYVDKLPREHQRLAVAWIALYEYFDWDDE